MTRGHGSYSEATAPTEHPRGQAEPTLPSIPSLDFLSRGQWPLCAHTDPVCRSRVLGPPAAFTGTQSSRLSGCAALPALADRESAPGPAPSVPTLTHTVPSQLYDGDISSTEESSKGMSTGTAPNCEFGNNEHLHARNVLWGPRQSPYAHPHFRLPSRTSYHRYFMFPGFLLQKRLLTKIVSHQPL